MNRLSSWKLIALAVAALAVEVTVADDLAWRGGRPELLLVLACFGALFAADRWQALLCCWAIGLIKDAGSAGPLGLHALLFVVAGWVVLQVRQVIFRDSIAIQAGVAAAGTAAVGLATAAVVSLLDGGVSASVWAPKILVSTAMTALLAPALIHLLDRTRLLVR